MGGVRVVHFVVCSTFCLQNGFFQPTKWYGHKLDYKMAFSSLQNGMAQARPYKMVFLCQLYWAFFFNNDFDIFIQKWSNICIHAPKKTPGPFCRASTLSGTQLQGQFVHSHFVGFLPCHSLFLNFTQNWFKKCFAIFARGQTVHFFANNILTFWKQIETKEWWKTTTQRHWKRNVQDSASKMPKSSIGEVRTGGIWHLVKV